MFEIDANLSDKEFFDLMRRNLTGAQWKSVARKAVGAGAAVTIKAARASLQSVTSRAKSNRTNVRHGWHRKVKNGIVLGYRSLQEGIRSKNHMDDWENIYRKINILHDFRLKFFEDGTKNRYTLGNGKTKYANRRKDNSHNTDGRGYRGKMNATDFFTKAVNSSRSTAQARVRASLETNIQKLFDKYKV